MAVFAKMLMGMLHISLLLLLLRGAFCLNNGLVLTPPSKLAVLHYLALLLFLALALEPWGLGLASLLLLWQT